RPESNPERDVISQSVLSSSFADFVGKIGKKNVGFLAVLWHLVWLSNATRFLAGKPTHATYPILPRSATAIRDRFHGTHVSDLRADLQWLGAVTTPSLHHRGHLLRRQRRQGPLGSLPSLLQRRGLGSRYPQHVLGPVRRQNPFSHGHSPVCRRRHLVSQAWADHLWRRHAPRSAHLQQGQTTRQLGTRLGRLEHPHCPSLLGPH